MTNREKSLLTSLLSHIEKTAESLRETANQMKRGEINQFHGANRILKLTNQLTRTGAAK